MEWMVLFDFVLVEERNLLKKTEKTFNHILIKKKQQQRRRRSQKGKVKNLVFINKQTKKRRRKKEAQYVISSLAINSLFFSYFIVICWFKCLAWVFKIEIFCHLWLLLLLLLNKIVAALHFRLNNSLKTLFYVMMSLEVLN